MTTPDPIAERFAAWRDTYTGRRTVPWEMLDEAARLIEVSLAYHGRQAEAVAARADDRVAALEAAHARELERAAERETRQRERAERAEADAKACRAQQTNLREQRETVEEGVVVRVSAPRVSGYGDRTHPRPWTLGELSSLDTRFRMAGATDDTEVRFKQDHVEACVPFPELVLPMDPRASASSPAERVEQRQDLAVVPRGLADWWLTVGLVLVVLSALLGWVVL